MISFFEKLYSDNKNKVTFSCIPRVERRFQHFSEYLTKLYEIYVIILKRNLYISQILFPRFIFISSSRNNILQLYEYICSCYCTKYL